MHVLHTLEVALAVLLAGLFAYFRFVHEAIDHVARIRALLAVQACRAGDEDAARLLNFYQAVG
jgi:hypothetical protein